MIILGVGIQAVSLPQQSSNGGNTEKQYLSATPQTSTINTNVHDASVDISSPTTNFGADPYILTYSEQDESHIISYGRFYMKFPLSSIPTSALVLSANISLYLCISTKDRTIGAHLVTNASSWKEANITWNNQPGFVTTASSTMSIPQSTPLGWLKFNVTGDVQSMVFNKKYYSLSNWISFCFKDENEQTPPSSKTLPVSALKYFYSANYTTVSLRPYLEVKYIPVYQTLPKTIVKEYIPQCIIYDPPGDQSYQEVSIASQYTVTFHLEIGLGLYLKLDVSGSMTTTETISSCQLSDPSKVGPGKGDVIYGYLIGIWFDVFQYDYPSGSYTQRAAPTNDKPIFYGDFSALRSELQYFKPVEDKTGTVGPKAEYVRVAQGSPRTETLLYENTTTITAGFLIDVAIPLSPISFHFDISLTWSGHFSYSATLYYCDSQGPLEFYRYSLSPSANLFQFQSIAWFGPVT
jgi:hypothetical protein